MKNISAESALKFSRIWIYVICKSQILFIGFNFNFTFSFFSMNFSSIIIWENLDSANNFMFPKNNLPTSSLDCICISFIKWIDWYEALLLDTLHYIDGSLVDFDERLVLEF